MCRLDTFRVDTCRVDACRVDICRVDTCRVDICRVDTCRVDTCRVETCGVESAGDLLSDDITTSESARPPRLRCHGDDEAAAFRTSLSAERNFTEWSELHRMIGTSPGDRNFTGWSERTSPNDRNFTGWSELHRVIGTSPGDRNFTEWSELHRVIGTSQSEQNFTKSTELHRVNRTSPGKWNFTEWSELPPVMKAEPAPRCVCRCSCVFVSDLHGSEWEEEVAPAPLFSLCAEGSLCWSTLSYSLQSSASHTAHSQERSTLNRTRPTAACLYIWKQTQSCAFKRPYIDTHA